MTTRIREKPIRRADPAGNERLTAMTGAVLLVPCGAPAGGLALAFATYHLSADWGGSGSIVP